MYFKLLIFFVFFNQYVLASNFINITFKDGIKDLTHGNCIEGGPECYSSMVYKFRGDNIQVSGVSEPLVTDSIYLSDVQVLQETHQKAIRTCFHLAAESPNKDFILILRSNPSTELSLFQTPSGQLSIDFGNFVGNLHSIYCTFKSNTEELELNKNLIDKLIKDKPEKPVAI
jgi:hypothetical protein